MPMTFMPYKCALFASFWSLTAAIGGGDTMCCGKCMYTVSVANPGIVGLQYNYNENAVNWVCIRSVVCMCMDISMVQVLSCSLSMRWWISNLNYIHLYFRQLLFFLSSYLFASLIYAFVSVVSGCTSPRTRRRRLLLWWGGNHEDR